MNILDKSKIVVALGQFADSQEVGSIEGMDENSCYIFGQVADDYGIKKAQEIVDQFTMNINCHTDQEYACLAKAAFDHWVKRNS